ncbi:MULTISPECIES: hypothetical protein [Enterobacteriaceae]|uniref:hypothetical protein n=1 Tax=Enterobacteriaceae TaxID=543 RepID=UPI001FFA7C6E|nr:MULTISPECIES: hypothetical protein [unclassified Citrobacter]
MSGSILRFRVISALIFSILAPYVAATPCFIDNSVAKDTHMLSKLTTNKDCNDTDSNSRKSVSEKIINSVAEKQKINQQIMTIDLEIGLLRTKKGSMTAQDYESKMRELTNKRLALKRKIK